MRAAKTAFAVCAAWGALLAPIHAQDSVSKTPCLPGDAVSPWDDATAALGQEQCNRYVLDLVPITTSWGTTFGIGPALKASRVNSTFFNGGISAQAISRQQVNNVPNVNVYGRWTAPGGGVNNDPAINDPGIPTPLGVGNQFAIAFAEFGATGAPNASHNGIIAGLVSYDPTNSGRLFIDRIVAAAGGCDPTSGLASFGFGAVDAFGNVILRADGFGISGVPCSGVFHTPLNGNNIFMVGAALRNCDVRNIISSSFPTGFDPGTTTWLVQNSTTTHNTPNIAGVGGPFYVGSNFNDEFVRGSNAGNVVSDGSHFATGVGAQRGSVAHVTRNHAAFNSVHGVCAILARAQGSGVTNMVNIWGLDANGNVSSARGITLPGNLTDPITNDSNILGTNEFVLYRDQTAFRGGNSQVALNVDAAGNLLVAGVVNHPNIGAANANEHYIPVARIDPAGNVTWVMAAYNASRNGNRKPILNGPNGTAIGRLTTMAAVTGGAINGPSFSAPMIDSAGNVWFLSAIELSGTPARLTVGLIRAVWDATRAGYELELAFASGDVVAGANSGRNYQISFLPVADTNSVSSGTAWSHNISEQGHNGQVHPTVPARSALNLGGLTISASITYDYDNDGDYESCIGTPGSDDQEYNVMLYLGALDDCQLDLGSQGPGTSQLSICGRGLGRTESSTIALSGAPATAPGALAISLAGFPDIPFAGGNLVSFARNLLTLPLSTSAAGQVVIPVQGSPAAVDLVVQLVTFDASLPQSFSISNAVLARFGR